MAYTIPPWLANTPDPVSYYAQGVRLGLAQGEESARQQMAQAQMQRQTQQDAIDNAYRQQTFMMQSEARARKYAAQKKYQDLLASGMDPAQALLQVAPDLGESLTGAAQLYKATRPPTMSPYQQAEVDLRKQQLEEMKKYHESRPQKSGIKYMNVGGALYKIDTDDPESEPELVSGGQKTGPSDAQNARLRLQALGQMKPTSSESPSDPSFLTRSNAAWNILNKFGGVPPAASVPQDTTNEVTRYTKDGRPAVFNAKTKEFLRFADETPDSPEIKSHDEVTPDDTTNADNSDME